MSKTDSHKASLKADSFGLLANEKAPRPSPSLKLGNYTINWLSTAIICVPPILILGAIIAGVPFQTKTFWAFLFCYFLNGFGITAGYHRLFAHRAYNGTKFTQALMSFAGAGAFQGSIKWWGRNHRIHHRYIDTDKDPYNATRGFFYTHVGWMLMNQDYGILGHVDISDYHSNKMIMFQHKFYLPIALLSGVILPTFICGLGWGDWLGGYFYAALGKMVLVHHTTFFINSLAHTDLFGASQNFSDKHTSHDSLLCAFLTLGEGYHNFHHEFANDYRNGVKWYHFDPTKWLIRGLEMVGLAKNLNRTPNDVIARNLNSLRLKKLDGERVRVQGLLDRMNKAALTTQVWTWNDIEERVQKGEALIVVGNYVLDLRKSIPIGSGYTHKNKDIIWYDAHPGGRKILDNYIGKDATDAFSGEIYRHSEAAINLLYHLRVASIKRE